MKRIFVSPSPLLFALCLLAAGHPARAGHPACAPPPELAATLEAASPARDGCQPFEDCWAEKIRRVEALLEGIGVEVPVHRTYQELVLARLGMRAAAGAPELAARYDALLAEHPRSPAAHYLRGRLSRGEEARAAHRRALELDPAFPWAHYELVTAALEEGRGDDAVTHMAAFLEACPGQVYQALRRSRELRNDPFWGTRLETFRRRLEEAPPAERERAFPLLWNLELQLAPPPRQGEARERVAEDTAALEALERRDSLAWWEALREGHRMAGNEAGVRRLEDGLLAAFPCSPPAVGLRLRRWSEAEGAPPNPPRLTPEQRRRLYGAAGEWLAVCPGSFPFADLRFQAAAALEDLPAAETRAVADAYLEIWERHRDHLRANRSPYRQVADLLLARGWDGERAAELLEREMELVERNRSLEPPLEEMPADLRRQLERTRLRQDVDNLLRLAEARLALDHREAARQALDRALALDPGNPAVRALLEKAAAEAEGGGM